MTTTASYGGYAPHRDRSLTRPCVEPPSYASQMCSLKGRRVLVWGACGFVGRHLVPRLLAHHADVSILTRPVPRAARPAWHDAVSWFVVDEACRLDRILASAVACGDIVYDLAGSSSAVQSNADPLGSLETDCRAQLLFLEACRAQGRSPHVVFVSTRLVYAPSGTKAVTEESRVEPRSMYAAHKLCVEGYFRIFGTLMALTYTILRTSPIFGFDERAHRRERGIVNAFVERSVRGEPIRIFGDGNQLRDFIFIEDVIDVIVAASIVPAARNTVLNAGRGESIRLRDAAETIRSMTGGPPVRHEPWSAAYSAVEVGDYVVDVGRCRETLGVSPRWTFEAGVASTLAAYGSRGPRRSELVGRR
jgi:UDP-glucose 4-epimerase